MASHFPSSEILEPESPIEHSGLALCIISGQGELRCRDPPIVVNREKSGSHLVSASFVALPEEAFRLFVCNYGSYDVGADVSCDDEYLGKWFLAREPQLWHHVAGDSLFHFHESYNRQSKVFKPTKIEIRFQHLRTVEERSQQAGLVPVAPRQPPPEGDPDFVKPGNDVIQSTFVPLKDDQFLTIVILFYPPVFTTTFPPPQTTPMTSPEPGLPSPLSSETDSTRSSLASSVSQMSDDELQDALTEHKDSRLLLPARLTPGSWGKVSVEGFCRRYDLPEEIVSALNLMNVKDAYGLSRIFLRQLRNHGLSARSINMLRVAVIRFSSEARP